MLKQILNQFLTKIKITAKTFLEKRSYKLTTKLFKKFCSQYNNSELRRERNSKRKNFMLQKRPIKIWDVNVDNIVISKLVKTKTNSKYLIGYLDKAIRPLVLIIPKMSGYVKTFKVEDKINKLMSFRINDEKLLGK